jgi:hypothetical protein
VKGFFEKKNKKTTITTTTAATTQKPQHQPKLLALRFCSSAYSGMQVTYYITAWE